MTTSCMQAIKQQLEAMPLDEFENLLKGASDNKGHEAMPQHAEILSQLKHHVKVQPDEPIQSKASDKECRTFWKSINNPKEPPRHQNHHQPRLSSCSSSANANSNINGNIGGVSPHLQYMNHGVNQLKHPAEYNSVGKTFIAGDQNANPVSSTSDTTSSTHLPIQNLNQGKYRDYNNHHNHHSTLAYGNSLDGDPGGRRSHERETKSNDNTITKCSTNKNSYNADDEEQEFDDKPENYTGKLPAQYILPNLTKINNSCKDLPIPIFPKPSTTTALTSGRLGQSSGNGSGSLSGENAASPSSTSWDLHSSQNTHVQLNDGYKSVASVTSGYNDRIIPSREREVATASTPSASTVEPTYGTIRSVSPTLPTATSSAVVSKSPTNEGSQHDKPARKLGGKKKNSKNVLRETLINPQEMPGYKGNTQDIDKLLEFVEGNQAKTKKVTKEKKKETKPKGNEKQVLSKAASLDENSLGYGSKKGEEGASARSRNSKDVEKKNSANITKSSTAICSAEVSSSAKTTTNEVSNAHEPISNKSKPSSTPLVNGGTPAPVPSQKGAAGKSASSGKSTGTSKSQAEVAEKAESPKSPETVVSVKSEATITPPRQTVEVKETKAVVEKSDDEKLKPDEAEGPYVLVQSKKKREKKKTQQRESENFARAHAEQARREGGRARRNNTERRKSVGSVPGSENSECSDDDDSVRSLPAGECTPRERIPKPCSSSGGTPQTSYADIARMSKDETGKTTTPPIALLPSSAKTPISVKSPPTVPVAVTSDSNFPALSPPSSSEKTVPVVGAAVWPCRPRFDPDGVVKEKSPSSKSEDAPSKEGAQPVASLPQQTSSQSISQKCSSKSIVDSKESSSHGKISSDKGKEVDASSTTDNSTPKVEVLQTSGNNNTTSRTNSCLDAAGYPAPQPANAKVPVNKKSDEKKAKDKSIKPSTEESLNKANLTKGTENNDSIINQPTEPVVFCGGKFDSSQLPVGQKSGFEFGFGVIEALNDNNNGVCLQSPTSDSPNTPIVIESAQGGMQSRSQDRATNQSNEDEKPTTLKKEQTSTKPLDKPNNNNNNGNLKNKGSSASLTGEVQSTRPAAGAAGPASSVGQQGNPPQSVNSVPATPPAETPVLPTNVPSPSIREDPSGLIAPTLNTADSKKPTTSKDFDIAQMFQSPNCSKIPDTVLQASEYMNAYANRLAALSKEGKISYHRI